MDKKQPQVIVANEVYEALNNKVPVVALESTIISHGMPYPQNMETALMLEEIVRNNGCVPATIAIIDGIIKVGLTEDDIDKIANGKKEVVKVSRRDIPFVTARGLCGATTVSATVFIASMCGIRVFATGGIGGVHRDYKDVLDISNDLEQLKESNIITVCAGVKSILDIPNTLEYLETQGVPVIGYKTLKMPAFYTESSPYSLEYSSDSPKDIAKVAYDKWCLNLNGGILVVNPIPHEYSYNEDEINKNIEVALAKAKDNNITGKRITPFLLKEIVEETNGKSLKANIELVKNNTLLASLIAKEFIEYEKN